MRSTASPSTCGAIKTPVMIVALKDDHVSAWKNTYAGPRLLRRADALPARRLGPQRRHDQSAGGQQARLLDQRRRHRPTPTPGWPARRQKAGSWWPEWQGWLDAAAGDDKVKARKVGSGKLKAGEAAPGSYVRVKH